MMVRAALQVRPQDEHCGGGTRGTSRGRGAGCEATRGCQLGVHGVPARIPPSVLSGPVGEVAVGGERLAGVAAAALHGRRRGARLRKRRVFLRVVTSLVSVYTTETIHFNAHMLHLLENFVEYSVHAQVGLLPPAGRRVSSSVAVVVDRLLARVSALLQSERAVCSPQTPHPLHPPSTALRVRDPRARGRGDASYQSARHYECRYLKIQFT